MYHNVMNKRNSFPTQSVSSKFRQQQPTSSQQIPWQKKWEMCWHRTGTHDLLRVRQTPKPLGHRLKKRIYTAVKLMYMYLWIKLGGHEEHYKHHSTLDMHTWTGDQLLDYRVLIQLLIQLAFVLINWSPVWALILHQNLWTFFRSSWGSSPGGWGCNGNIPL